MGTHHHRVMPVIQHVPAQPDQMRRQLAPRQPLVQRYQPVGEVHPYGTVQAGNGRVSASAVSYCPPVSCGTGRFTYLSAGSRPKKVTKVMNDIARITPTIVPRVPMMAVVTGLAPYGTKQRTEAQGRGRGE